MTYVTNAERIGEKRGAKQGETTAKIKIAKNMMKKGYPIKDIAEITGLTAAEIKAIREK